MGPVCPVCAENGTTRKFQSMEALQRHLDQTHKLQYCKLCLSDKPVFLSEQQLFSRHDMKYHNDKHHPRCEHCPGRLFYDFDALYKHYREDHFLCELCKKMGKKKRNKRTGAVEYEVFKDNAALRAHCERKHYVCKKKGCAGLVFKDQALLAHHMAYVHGETMTIKLAFKHSDSEDSDQLPEDYHQR